MKKCWFNCVCAPGFDSTLMKRMRNYLTIHRKQNKDITGSDMQKVYINRFLHFLLPNFLNVLVADWRALLHHGFRLLALHPLLGLLSAAPAPLPDLSPGLGDRLHVQVRADLGG